MPKVTSKLQLTVPKIIADAYGIRPGDELEWVPAGEVIRVVPQGRKSRVGAALSVETRLELFDQARKRQRKREAAIKTDTKQQSQGRSSTAGGRGWKREDLYNRGLSD